MWIREKLTIIGVTSLIITLKLTGSHPTKAVILRPTPKSLQRRWAISTHINLVLYQDDGLQVKSGPMMVTILTIDDIPPATEIIKALETSSLAPFLRTHLRVLSTTFDRLSQGERTVIFDHSVDLTLSVLRQAMRGENRPELISQCSYFLAAKRLIHELFSDPNLDTATLAQILGCSRSTLYRAFASKGWTVADYIKEVRMREASYLLSSGDPELTVVAVASQCGYVNSSHFSRVFRERFGMTPNEARMSHPVQPLSDETH